ncbi:MAG: response regulator, partial [Desulfovibrionaceae bacterium]|nr:response regulator [Desulfovibrionaceae bacterium]
LVVDDDHATCDSIINILSQFGIRSQCILSGAEAILLTKKAVTENNHYSLFLIDWKLPDRSGIDVAREIREIVGHKAPIILITPYDWINEKDDAKLAGVNEFCTKPVFRSELYQVISKVFLDSSEQPSPDPSDQVENFDLQGKRLLLVDDMEINREIAVTILSMNGMEVEEACDGDEAVARVAEVAPGYYDCIVMDIQMPKMNGYEATRAIRSLEDKARASVPIIAMTANAFDEDKKAAIKAGMNAHIAKPIDVPKLLEALSQILCEKSNN